MKLPFKNSRHSMSIGFTISLILLISVSILQFLFVTNISATTETRYFRSDTQSINSLTAYQLGTTQSASSLSTTVSSPTGNGNQGLTVYWGIRVWKRNSAGTETEITSGTPVAQVSRNAVASGLQSATWTPTLTSLSTTDSIVARVYIQVGTGGWLQGATAPIFTTEQLGNPLLENQLWTIYYFTEYTGFSGTPSSGRYSAGTFYWGNATYNSRIENFTHSSPVVTVGTTGTQASEIQQGQTHAYIGGAFTLVSNAGSSSVTSITISETGTIADSNISGLILYYKQEATCSTSIPVDATQFNGTAGTFSSGSSTVTGSMTVGTSQICLYAEIDVGSGAGVGDTVEIQITNPSTQVVTSAGTVTPASAVAISGTTTVTASGVLAVDIVDGTYTPVSSPSVGLSSTTVDFVYQTSTGTLGNSSEMVYMTSDSTTSWQVSIAPSGGSTALWSNIGNTLFYDFNDSTANAQDGADTDSYGGQLTINASSGTLSPGSGCTNANISLGSSSAFVEDVINAITLISATNPDHNCEWTLTGIGLSQSIPKEQMADSYSISLTITITAV